MNWWVAGSITAAAAVVVVAICYFPERTPPPYKHVLTNVERVDEDEDALEVYHDKVRGVTCYSFRNGSPSCVPDIWLTPHSGAP